jgi:Transposase DDE domain group 1
MAVSPANIRQSSISSSILPRSCRTFAANAVRLQLHALAYNLGNFLRTLATPEPIKDWSLTSLKDKLIKIGAKVVSHGRYVAFQMASACGRQKQPFQDSSCRSSVERGIRAAATFSSRCASDDVPGMGTMTGERASSQAIATCTGVAPRCTVPK